jgi:SAM-dependent methyltransferase
VQPLSPGGATPRTPRGHVRLKDEGNGPASAGDRRDRGPADGYPRFYAAVALAQLTGWLPGDRRFLIDISGPGARTAEVAARAGHSVLRVIDPEMPVPPPVASHAASGRLSTVTADGTGLEFLPDGCADGVIAEERTLSLRLGAEDLVTEIARVLRPGGQLLACVDSLTFGMSLLAEQHRWPHLVDVPNADVVLIPWPDGTITRCYGAEQLRELFTGSGLEVSWIRPRTVLSPQTVGYLLARDPSSFGELVSAELHARSDDSVGAQLIAACIKSGGAVLPAGGRPPCTPRHGRAPPPVAPLRGAPQRPRSPRAPAEVQALWCCWKALRKPQCLRLAPWLRLRPCGWGRMGAPPP